MEESLNAKKLGAVRVAFACCFASFCFHGLCLAYQLMTTPPDEGLEEGGVAATFYYFSTYPILAGAGLLFSTFKTISLNWRMDKQNLTGAFKADKDGDLEKGVVGTELHRETAMDMTVFTYASCLVGYVLTLALRRFFGDFDYVPTYVFNVFMVTIFAISSGMNYRVLLHSRLRNDKLDRDQCSSTDSAATSSNLFRRFFSLFFEEYANPSSIAEPCVTLQFRGE